MVIGRPTTSGVQTTQCPSSCSDLGHADPLNKDQLGPRPNREKVRQQVRDYILHMLGAPVITIELDEQNIDFCIDQAMKIVEEYAPREYFQYYVFMTTPGQSVYEMPPEIGIVRNVFYKEQGSFAFQASDLDGALPVEYFYPSGAYASIQGGMLDPTAPIWGRAGEWFLYKQYEQLYSRLSSNIGGWEWVGDQRHIKLYPTPCKGQKVIVHYMQKCKDWGEVTQSIQEGSHSYALEILGRIRSKIKNPPGPNGGIQLDGEALLQEAKESRKQWFEDLITKFSDLPYISMG